MRDDPGDISAKEMLELQEEEALPEWNEIVCGMCPAFERFTFDEDCANCKKTHQSDRGLCRGTLPKLDPQDGERGRWPLVNIDDWCVPGREMVLDAMMEPDPKPEK